MRAWQLVALASVAIACAGDATDEPADTVLLGGTIRTMDPGEPLATAAAIRGGRFVYVGDDTGAGALVGASTTVIDLEGRLVLPGFHDTHVHPLSGGVGLGECDLHPAVSRADVVRLLSECAADTPDAPWMRGSGFDPTLFPDGAPSKELLDSLVPDRPAYVTDATEHAAWVNTRALAESGIDGATPDPSPDGVIVRTSDGSPQGTLREAAMGLVAQHLPRRTDAELAAGLDRGLALAASLGITTLHEASADESALRAYAAAERDGRSSARVVVALQTDPTRGPEQVSELVALRERFDSPLVRVVAAKIFVDGVLEGGTAWLLAPYLDRPGWRGEPRIGAEPLASLVAALDSAGFKVHLHVIGDGAVRAALDALARQRDRDGGSGPRHVLAHLQLIDPSDVGRIASVGAVASFQPLWAQRDAYITDLTEPRLGPERSGRLYAIRSVLGSGAIVAAGSDWPVTTMDPWDAIEVALTRRDSEAPAGEAWLAGERIGVDEAVRAYTVGGALAGDLEAETGTITVGKSADLVVLDRDPWSVAPTEISDVRVETTMLEGRVVYRRPGG